MLSNHVIKYQNKSSDIPTIGPFSRKFLSLELFRTRLATPEFCSAVKSDAELEGKI